MVGDRGQRRVQALAQVLDQRGKRPGEVLVVAFSEPVPPHLHTASEVLLVAVQGDQRFAFLRGQPRAQPGVGPLPERRLDVFPRDLPQPGRQRHSPQHAIVPSHAHSVSCGGSLVVLWIPVRRVTAVRAGPLVGTAKWGK